MSHHRRTPATDMIRWVSLVLAVGLLNSPACIEAFTHPSIRSVSRLSIRSRAQYPLYFFRNGDKEEGENDSDESADAANDERRSRIPFFGRLMKKEGLERSESSSTVDQSSTTSEIGRKPAASDDPVEVAKALREQAERAKLEAERMDAALTLEKIEKLEKQLAKAKSKESTDNSSVEELQRQMDNLQAKLRGEAPKPVVVPKPEKKEEMPKEPSLESALKKDGLSKVEIKFKAQDDLMGSFDEIKKNVDVAPPFFQKLLATQVGYVYDSTEPMNTTEIARRLYKASVSDFSFSDKASPEFTQEQIDKEVKKMKDSGSDKLPVSDEMVRLADGNLTKLAIYGMEYNYYLSGDDLQQNFENALEGDEFMEELKKALSENGEDIQSLGSNSAVMSLYPKCAYNNKEDEMPTEAQMGNFVSSVLTKTKFKATGVPEKKLGGYIVRGTHPYETGDELIDAIDAAMEKSIVKDKMTVLYTNDIFVNVLDEQAEQQIESLIDGEADPVLFVMSPDICREKKPVALSVVSAFGLATSWYLAVYPFLLNPTLATRIEEQVELANSNMAFDLDFLTDMSVPLFYTFIGLQIIGEIAHNIVARANGVSKSFPFSCSL